VAEPRRLIWRRTSACSMNGMLLLAHPKEGANDITRVSDTAADFFDHQPFDAAGLVALWIIDCRLSTRSLSMSGLPGMTSAC
jgi:hypothetical protein